MKNMSGKRVHVSVTHLVPAPTARIAYDESITFVVPMRPKVKARGDDAQAQLRPGGVGRGSGVVAQLRSRHGAGGCAYGCT